MDNYIGHGTIPSGEGAMIDKITLITLGIFLVSLVIFAWFGKFTLNLMKQHNDIYSLLFALEEEEKKRK